MVQKTGVETDKKNTWEEKRALYSPAIMNEASSDTSLLRESRWQSGQQDAWPVTSTNFPGKCRHSVETDETETSRPQVIGAGNDSMTYPGNPLAYRRRTNVTTKKERNHQQGWSDKPETNSTESTARGTQEKIQTNTVSDRVHVSEGEDIDRTRSHTTGPRS